MKRRTLEERAQDWTYRECRRRPSGLITRRDMTNGWLAGYRAARRDVLREKDRRGKCGRLREAVAAAKEGGAL